MSTFKIFETWLFDHNALIIIYTKNYCSCARSTSEKLQPFAKEEEVYHLREISLQELQDIRKDSNAGFLYKNGDKLYYVRVPKNCIINSSTLNVHQCCPSDGKTVCYRLSSLPDPDGCEKIRRRKKYLESFKFIEIGYQTLNCKEKTFRVCKCLNYLEVKNISKKSFLDRKSLLSNIEDLYQN